MSCLTCVSATSSVMAGSLNATWRISPLRQSSSMAIPSRPMTAMDWSMIPQGAPAKSFSARWQRAARSCPSIARGAPVAAISARAVATSSAAELESPPPTGTVDSSSTSAPASRAPAASSSAATPAG